MTKRKLATLVLTIFAVTGSATAESGLVPFDAKYRVKVSALRGEMRMSLARTESGYSADSSLVPRGLARLIFYGEVTEHSEFSVSDGALTPLHYESIDTLAKNDQAIKADFDYENHLLGVTVNETNVEFPLGEPTYDRVSIQYALMLGLKRGTASTDYAMLDGDEIKALTVEYEEGLSIRVPYGEFAVRKVEHSAAQSDRVTTLWCADELGFLPVRIEQRKNGKLLVRAELTDYSPTDGPPADGPPAS